MSDVVDERSEVAPIAETVTRDDYDWVRLHSPITPTLKPHSREGEIDSSEESTAARTAEAEDDFNLE
ncbi:hypothetical protein EUX98_g5013 [Antrodiella citrinella]|uniref:Uncharacterized protein n=1 Tax=Antrodiella citrinella TaxID=2447956 RepID=A0A4S4MSK4_9APHY|nr:hypothetical protein EUX98_g5013 [Antrodiella citrinella]